MSPRSEELLAVARQRLEAARSSLAQGHPEVALSTAYYAVLYAARAALSEQETSAKTHSGTWTLFREAFVLPGRFDPDLFSRVHAIQSRREASDYDAVRISGDEAGHSLELAASFLDAVTELIGD